MAARTIKYHTCELDILEPTEQNLTWTAVIWPPSDAPIIVLSNASEAGAVAAAEAEVDEMQGGPSPHK